VELAEIDERVHGRFLSIRIEMGADSESGASLRALGRDVLL
jgi:hypothetical protein